MEPGHRDAAAPPRASAGGRGLHRDEREPRDHRQDAAASCPRRSRAASSPKSTRSTCNCPKTFPHPCPRPPRPRWATARGDPYDQAVAIQDYLRSSAFSYSEKTPVEDGYDGSGMEVIDAFLQEKAGYCVHFASTMALMARELGIPSRLVTGYSPGTPTGREDHRAERRRAERIHRQFAQRPRLAGTLLPRCRVGGASSRRPGAGSLRPTHLHCRRPAPPGPGSEPARQVQLRCAFLRRIPSGAPRRRRRAPEPAPAPRSRACCGIVLMCCWWVRAVGGAPHPAHRRLARMRSPGTRDRATERKPGRCGLGRIGGPGP